MTRIRRKGPVDGRPSQGGVTEHARSQLRPMTLTEAAAQLGLAPSTLRRQIHNGAMRGTLVGKTWTVTPREVERYRAESLGRVGRKAGR